MRITPSRTTLRHPAAIAAAVLALTLAAVPFLPDGNDPQGSITPSAERARTPHRGVVTPDMQRRDRPRRRGRSRTSAEPRPDSRGPEAARCATFEGQRYCLGVGWTNRSPRTRCRPADVAARRRGARSTGETTGDLDAAAALARATSRSASARIRAERAELTAAAELGRQGVDAAPRHPGGAAARRLRGGPPRDRASPAESPATTRRRQPSRPRSLPRPTTGSRAAVAEPHLLVRSGHHAGDRLGGRRRSGTDQAVWARRLRTTSAGTAITDLVRVINNHTGTTARSTPAPTSPSTSATSPSTQWYRLMMRHIHDYRAPVVLHPVLLKQYYPYLDDDASGHFQVGRGYDQNPDGNRQIGYFEPWDQSRFDPSEPAIDRVQWRNRLQVLPRQSRPLPAERRRLRRASRTTCAALALSADARACRLRRWRTDASGDDDGDPTDARPSSTSSASSPGPTTFGTIDEPTLVDPVEAPLDWRDTGVPAGTRYVKGAEWEALADDGGTRRSSWPATATRSRSRPARDARSPRS